MNKSEDFLESLYYEFEQIHRGKEELIRKRLEFYRPIFQVYKEFCDKNPKFLDIGCGRGEFLELALSEGFEVEGVEINSIYVDICKKKGLKVYHQDGLSFLQSQPDAKYSIISMIHVIEHLELEYLLKILLEIKRVLLPGGVLILETPYAKNPIVGLYNFWLDPTHKRPVHEEFIKFLGKNLGFANVEFIGINAEHRDLNEIKLSDAFFSSAPDLSAILIKDTEDKSLLKNLLKAIEILKENRSKDFIELLARYDGVLAELVEKTSEKFNSLDAELRSSREELNQVKARYDGTLAELVEKISVVESTLMMIYNSKLWRLYRTLSNIKNSIKDTPKKVAFFLYRKIEKNPWLYKVIRNYVNKNPKLKARLKRLLFGEVGNYIQEYIYENKVTVLDIEEKFFLKKLKRYKNESIT